MLKDIHCFSKNHDGHCDFCNSIIIEHTLGVCLVQFLPELIINELII